MKTRRFLIQSVIVIGGFWIGLQIQLAPSTPAAIVKESSALKERVKPAAPDLSRSTVFNWSSVESTNYFDYIKNLRQIGCPEETVCDIIKSEIDKMFSERWKQTQKPFSEKRYWVAVPYPDILKRRQNNEIARFESEKAALMQQLLGVFAGQCGCAEEKSPADRMIFSSEEKQKKVAQILKDFEAKERELDIEVDLSTNKMEIAQSRSNLIAQKREALAGVLEPEELKQLELAASPRARYLREYLFGFQPTETEFRAIYDCRQASQNVSLSDQINDAPAGGSFAIRKEIEDQLRSQVGEERYNEFRLMAIPDYQSMSMVGKLLRWDSKTLAPALALIQEYSKTEQQELRNPQVNLQNLRTQRDEKLRAILGDAQFEEFKRRKVNGTTSGPTFQYW